MDYSAGSPHLLEAGGERGCQEQCPAFSAWSWWNFLAGFLLRNSLG
jgi:hypothetical protein